MLCHIWRKRSTSYFKETMVERTNGGWTCISKRRYKRKCFIEYIPAEKAWVPIKADGYMHINCFWVSGSYKGKGYSNDLLDACINDARKKGKKGVTVLSSPKKMPFLSDPKYLAYKGFLIADTANPFFTLMYLPLEKEADIPKFKEQVKQPQMKENGFVLFYTNGCPYTAKYVPIVEEAAKSQGISFQSIKIDSLEKAKNAPVAWTNYALFYNGKYITNEILSEKKFISIYESLKSE